MFLEHLGMTRIAVFSSQAEKINVSIRFQTTKSTTNKAREGRHRSQHDEEGLRESDFWIRDKASEDLQSYTMIQSALVLKVKRELLVLSVVGLCVHITSVFAFKVVLISVVTYMRKTIVIIISINAYFLSVNLKALFVVVNQQYLIIFMP